MIAGQLDLIFDNQPSIGPYLTAGRVRGLAVTGSVRSTAFPDLPTIAKAGVPGYEITTWTGMIAPAGVPKAIVARLNAEIQRACASPALKERIAGTGSACAAGSTEQFVEFVKREQIKWGDIVRRSGAKID
jgi:tripartite-type tricarboxylate transporter receptor subunit TctC